ncbi:aldose 1-epimerase [Frateuria sp. STR12]|uniref:aldose 1-epimerase n=1 Tax=Frateuria hangzhouensis TaxID=2995589 RepID=UPI002260B769|nr:aldose epimerase [Frateuria sp. STR12]MCX7512526.1 aldose epimerase [Frateuria sp. STR12]
MGAFDAAIEWLDTQPVVVLDDTVRGRRVRIARHGACVLGLAARFGGGWLELADGHRDAVELGARPGSRFAVLAPFANRIADARYRFDGIEHDLLPDAPDGARASRHGFARDADFAIGAMAADERTAQVAFTTTIGPRPGYPFTLDLAVRYTLAADGLTLQTTLRNVGITAAPAFVGWHPYFRLGDGPLASWELNIPADCVIRTDQDFIPLPAETAYLPLDQAPELDFRQPRAIGTRQLNHTYARLRSDADGRARTWLREPKRGLAIAVWQEHGVMLAFTGDTLERGARRSIALEPMESLPDAFNRADCAHAIRLEPGAARTFRCGVEIDLP